MQSTYYKTSEDIEVDKGKRVQFKDVLKSLDTSIGATIMIDAMDEQERKLESFKVAAETVNINVRKVKDKGIWKEEEDMNSPEETNETAALRSLTFTLDDEKKDTIKEIIPVFKELNDLEFEDLH